MIVFEEWFCTCPHPASSHDDGFGCTEEIDGQPCPCLAGWQLEQEVSA